MRVAFITTDARDHYREYTKEIPYFGTAPQALLEGFSGMENLEVHVISCLHRPFKSPKMLAPNIYYHGLVVGNWAWMKSGYVGCVAAVRRKLKEIRPDVVHGQGTERDCALDAVFSGYPNVLTIHGNMGEIQRLQGHRLLSFYGMASKLERLSLKKTGGVVCITRYTRDLVRDQARKTWLLPNAVDSRYFGVEKEGPTEEGAVLLVVGVVCPRKNQVFLIQALDSLAKEMKFSVRFLGTSSADSEYDRQFLRLVRERSWCSHAGFVSRDGLKEELGRAVGLILPSLEDNCPMVVLEAMAAGVPVVAAKVGGIPDLIDEFRTGLLVDPKEGESIVEAVRLLLSKPQQMEMMAQTAKKEAKERFHPKVIAKKHLEIYREILDGLAPS